jgi:hypothetical protein
MNQSERGCLSRQHTEKWKNPPLSWHAANAQLAIQFKQRFVVSE